MSKLFIEDTSLVAIGDAIRAKTGKSAKLTPAQMASEIGSITTGGGGGSSSGLPTPPEGGWTYATSPWSSKFNTTTTYTRDYWNFDVTGCNEITITLVYLPNSNSNYSYANNVIYNKHYGFEIGWGDNVVSGNAEAPFVKIDSNAKQSNASAEEYLVTQGTTKVTKTFTFNVADYTRFSMIFCVASAKYSSACALYVSDIKYN